MPIPISLITTVHNRPPFLPNCLDSILAQTYLHFDLLIGDDRSTDNSLDIAQHHAQKDDRRSLPLITIKASRSPLEPRINFRAARSFLEERQDDIGELHQASGVVNPRSHNRQNGRDLKELKQFVRGQS